MSANSDTFTFIPDAIKQLRKSILGLSQRDFANFLHRTPQSIKDWEHNRSTPNGEAIYSMYHLLIEQGHDISEMPEIFKSPEN